MESILDNKLNSLPPKSDYSHSKLIGLNDLDKDPQVVYFTEARNTLASDPYRPAFHFSPPQNVMNDPNGLCHWNGYYHLFYQYRPGGHNDVVHWGHAMSSDMVSWNDMPIALYPETEKDCFSGQSLVEDNRVIAIYHGTESGNAIATSTDPLLVTWIKNPHNPVIPIVPVDSTGYPYRVFDPCIWKEGEYYYSLSGTYRNGERSVDCEAVDHIFRSKDLSTWEYLGSMLESGFLTEPGEDGAVPNFLPIGSGKHLFLFFSHKRASQYFIGEYDEATHKFHPEIHGRMNYGPLTVGRLHAPSATIDKSGRIVSIYNVKESIEYRGWSDIMSLPRVLSLSSEGALSIEPVEEINSLRSKQIDISNKDIPANEIVDLKGVSGNQIEINIKLDPGEASECGLYVLQSPDKQERTRISFMRTTNRWSKTDTLQIDASESSKRKDVLASPPETGPLFLGPDEPLNLQIYVDRSIVEVFANGKQCLTLRVYPDNEASQGVSIFARGGRASLLSLTKWDMKSIWSELI